MRGKSIWNNIKLVFRIFITLPFRLLNKKFYLFVPDEIISEKNKEILENTHIVAALFFLIISYIPLRENSLFYSWIEEYPLIVPLTLLLLFVAYGLIIGIIIIWVLKITNENYNAYLKIE